MKNILLVLCTVFLLWGAPVVADTMVTDPNATGTYPDNPEDVRWHLGSSSEANEAQWLSDLLSGADVYFIDKDEDGPSYLDEHPDVWDYAILKFGVGDGHSHVPDSYAIWDDDDDDGPIVLASIDLLPGISSLPDIDDLSHTSYFSATPVPEPATMLLLGTGLVGLAGVGRKKFLKK